MMEVYRFDVQEFLNTFKFTNPHIRVFCGREGKRLFPHYSQMGLPLVNEVCCLVLEGWGHSAFLDGGAFPQPLAISGGNDNGWYAATLPVIHERDYGPVQFGSMLDGYAAKMLQLQREERHKRDERRTLMHPIITFADRTWATFRKKISAFIAA